MKNYQDKTYQSLNKRNAVIVKYNTSINRKSTYNHTTPEALTTDYGLIKKVSISKDKNIPRNDDDKIYLPKINNINLKSEYYSAIVDLPNSKSKIPLKSLNIFSIPKNKKIVLTPVLGMNKILNSIINNDNFDQNNSSRNKLNSQNSIIIRLKKEFF